MRLLFALVAAMLAISACTLGTAQEMREDSLNATQTALPLATLEQAADPLATPATLEFPPTPALLTNESAVCGRLRVDVGTDPGNTLRLREQPSNTAKIILLIPNNKIVMRVEGSQEVSAGGYTWVNIEYTDPNGVVATGWAAKDAMANRETLRREGC